MEDFYEKASPIMVSVLCITYNHQDYIHEALNSIVNQKCSFRIELLVNDDAPSDCTPKIIKEMQQRYPEIIKPIFQTENQYQKGIDGFRDILIPKAQGKYIAFCEGDDFWNDSMKLEKQIEYMESHQECSLCIHNAYQVDLHSKVLGEIKTTDKDRVIFCDEVIERGGLFCATSSIVAQRRLLDVIPHCIQILGMDYIYQIFFASQGTTYCFSEKMSSYRVGVPGSWSVKRRNKSVQETINEWSKTINALDVFNRDTNYKYNSSVEKVIVESEVEILELQQNYETLKQDKYERIIRKFSTKRKLKFYLKKYCPGLEKCIANTLYKIRKGSIK